MTLPIHHITLTVTDVATSARWYQDLLGEADAVHREGDGWRRTRMRWPNNLVIGVTEFDGFEAPARFSHLNLGLDHVGLECQSEEEVRQWDAKLTDLGFTHGPVEEAPYGWAVTA